MHVDSASSDASLGSTSPPNDESRTSGIANLAAWTLIVAFVSLVLSVAVPAMTDSTRGDVAAALLFMLGLTASLVGTGLAVSVSTRRVRTVVGGLLILVGLVLLYGLVPSLVALGAVLLGVAVEIGSIPED
jgi:hypothetical protein